MEEVVVLRCAAVHGGMSRENERAQQQAQCSSAAACLLLPASLLPVVCRV